MFKKFFITLIIFLSLLQLPSLLSAPFSDISVEYPLYFLLERLKDKGIIDGYPDFYFRGDRPLSRYEMAIIISRVIVKLEELNKSVPDEPDFSLYLEKEDIELLNDLTVEFSEELEHIGLRVNRLEDTFIALNKSIEELERVKIQGKLDTVAISSGYSPDEFNTESFGTPLSPSYGPSVLPDRDRYKSPPGSSQLFEGFSLISLVELNVTSEISSCFKAGGDFVLYSAFGEKGITDQWGLKPPYNPLGQVVHKNNFQAYMSTLWFDTDGKWNFRGNFGDYKPKNISKNLFNGLGTSVWPMNGIQIYGTLYGRLELEGFIARNINTFDKGNATGIPNEFRYLLAVPYNDGAGAVRVKKYGIADEGQYDNYVHGIWAGYNFSGGKARIEGAFLRLYEDYSSNPALGTDPALTSPPKDSLYYGVKAYYKWPEDKVKIYGEFNQTCFDYNLLDENDGFRGSFYNLGASFQFVPFRFYGEYIRVEPNYDPLAYHQHWDIIYKDRGDHHYGWGWKYGLFACNGRRFSRTQPNREGIGAGLNYRFGRYYDGTIYFDFTYLGQINPTMITGGENSFQEYDFLSGNPVLNSTGINIYGNQDYFFTENDGAKGCEYNIEAGFKNRFGDIHIWSYFEYENFIRNYESKSYDLDISYYFANAGLTYDLTHKLSLQGYVEYIRCSGVNKFGREVLWDQVIPGVGLSYSFTENSEFLIDYKFYSYNSEFAADVYDTVPDTVNNYNNYNANKLFTRLRIEF